MTYTLFFIPDYQFQQVFFMFPQVIIFLLFLWRPLSCRGPLATAQFACVSCILYAQELENAQKESI